MSEYPVSECYASICTCGLPVVDSATVSRRVDITPIWSNHSESDGKLVWGESLNCLSKRNCTIRIHLHRKNKETISSTVTFTELALEIKEVELTRVYKFFVLSLSLSMLYLRKGAVHKVPHDLWDHF